MIVERTDFVSVPVEDMARARRFYAETLGLPPVGEVDAAWPEFQLGENVSLYLIDPTNIGQAFTAPHRQITGLCHRKRQIPLRTQETDFSCRFLRLRDPFTMFS